MTRMITTRTAITKFKAPSRTSSFLFPLFDAPERRHKGRSLGVVGGPDHVATSGNRAENASTSVGKGYARRGSQAPAYLGL